mmetsp:Transcript_17749/g.31059  ORF Transcript_17749/g.31059 Transcript_17749/m.31059 type:complete len:174 (+) Transcript_17749:57-578(+)
MAGSQAASDLAEEKPQRWKRRARQAEADESSKAFSAQGYVSFQVPDLATATSEEENRQKLVVEEIQRPDVADAVPPPPAPFKARSEFTVEKQKPQEPCPICMEHFQASEGMPRTCRKCNNSFHQACLAEWAKKEQQIKWEQKPWMLPSQFESGSCPCCRSSKGHDKSRRWRKE